jgi:hypothetical protein
LFHDNSSLEEGFSISINGLFWWNAGCSQAEVCTNGRKQDSNNSLQRLHLFITGLYPTARHTKGENQTLFQSSTHFENFEK